MTFKRNVAKFPRSCQTKPIAPAVRNRRVASRVRKPPRRDPLRQTKPIGPGPKRAVRPLMERSYDTPGRQKVATKQSQFPTGPGGTGSGDREEGVVQTNPIPVQVGWGAWGGSPEHHPTGHRPFRGRWYKQSQFPGSGRQGGTEGGTCVPGASVCHPMPAAPRQDNMVNLGSLHLTSTGKYGNMASSAWRPMQHKALQRSPVVLDSRIRVTRRRVRSQHGDTSFLSRG